MKGAARGRDGAAASTRSAGSPRPSISGQALQPQDLAITLLGEFVRPDPRPVWSGGMVRLLEEFGFSTSAARAALSRLVRRGLLARIRAGRLVFYEITRRCETLLADGDRRIFSLGSGAKWNGTWTVVWHSIPERQRLERSRFGRRLRFLGFGSVQDGTWISPHDREREVQKVVEELSVEEHVGVLLGRPGASLRMDELINRGWDLRALAERYEEFRQEYGRYLGPKAPRLDEREAFIVRTTLVHSFRQFPFLDPELPDELMPRPSARAEAVRTFHALYERLREPAQAHFDEVATAVSPLAAETGIAPSRGSAAPTVSPRRAAR